MPLGNVDALSDDDAAVGGAAQLAQVPDSVQVKPSDAAVVPAAKRQLPGDRSIVSVAASLALRQQLRKQVDSTCRCRRRSQNDRVRRSCFAPFREERTFERLYQLRKLLMSMSKEDADKKVFKLYLLYSVLVFICQAATFLNCVSSVGSQRYISVIFWGRDCK